MSDGSAVTRETRY
ncbi:unnamed protein product [Callosobruchus maculatus]|uniref:Uncharacterized protein n=1 Tax=Callosobruchus maculatus TaxID=64391 RepID=A0A653DA55_CALMS|nr:unnamed protein product [Callosobruchus maculatus]